MSRPRRFVFIDGREVEADSPVALLEALRGSEHLPPATLDRYLDLLHSRGALGFGLRLDVGAPGEAIEARCHRALGSLIAFGWVRPVASARRRVAGRCVPIRTGP
ncbi:MAG: hypothetical protein HY317_05740 [Acidobacteria bacterium]|nr:hypothetical protein [Acidobacteriota bacterium]